MSQRILILEDNADLRSALERFIRRRGFEVSAVGTVAEAVAELGAGDSDLLITDVDLPDGSGLALIQRLQETGSTIPAILITGLPDMALAAKGIKAGAVDFLTKPMDLEALGAVMDRALERARRSSRAGTPKSRAEGDEWTPGEVRLVGRHPSIVELYKKIGTAAASAAPVLIRGESGTGKELIAREIHRHSRPEKPFVALNCASVSDSLLESELFGHERGAFTGAGASRRGHFELAGGGTLFLDEIGDASPAFQATILRVLQEGEFLPVGGERTRRFHARVIAATHRPLEERVQEGSFRADLFYRIQVLEMELPPLRDRLSDLPELAGYLLARTAAHADRSAPEISAEAMGRLLSFSWPGNVRELENVLERAVLDARWDLILPEHIDLPTVPQGSPGSPRAFDLQAGSRDQSPAGSTPVDSAPAGETLDDAMRRHVELVLERCEGNKREAARRLDISPGRLYRLLGEEG